MVDPYRGGRRLHALDGLLANIVRPQDGVAHEAYRVGEFASRDAAAVGAGAAHLSALDGGDLGPELPSP